MTIRKLIDTEGLENICKMAGWQGGTIHQAETWVKAKLARHGVFTHKDTGLVSPKFTQDNCNYMTDRILEIVHEYIQQSYIATVQGNKP